MELLKKQKATSLLYYLSASIILFFLISRAISLNIQGDEVGTYFRARAGLGPILRLEDPNNHFLNTALIYITTLKAEYSEIAIRLPSIAIYSWFIFIYVPRARCFKGWEGRLLFLGVINLSFYFGEYVSMARGYAMSGCFAAAAFSELIASEPSKNRDSLIIIKRDLHLTVFAFLSVLASLSAAPLAAFILLREMLKRKRGKLESLNLSIRSYNSNVVYFVGLVLIIAFAAVSYQQIKASNIALPVASLPLRNVPRMLLELGFIKATISAAFSSFGEADLLTAFNKVSNTLVLVFLVLASFVSAIKITVKRKDSMDNETGFASANAMKVLYGSLLVVLVIGVFSTYPGGRVWLTYWPSVSVMLGVLGEYSFNNYLIGRLPISLIVAPVFLTLGLLNLSLNFTTNYVTELRPFYYQYKSLMHYSKAQNLRCLAYGDINDNVLRFYFMNPKGGIPEPKECSNGEQSQPGFMQYSHKNKEPFFE